MKKSYVNGVMPKGCYYNSKKYYFSADRKRALLRGYMKAKNGYYYQVEPSASSDQTSGYKHTITLNNSVKFDLYSPNDIERKLTAVPSGYKFVWMNVTSEVMNELTLVYDGNGLFHIAGTLYSSHTTYYNSSKSLNKTGKCGIFLLDSNDNIYLSTTISASSPFSVSYSSSSTSATYTESTLTYSSRSNIKLTSYEEIPIPYEITSAKNITDGKAYYTVSSGPTTYAPLVDLSASPTFYVKDYTLLDCIESNGNQYINTNFMPTKYTDFEIDFMYLGTSYSGWTCLYGERGSSDSTYLALFINSSNPSASSPYISPNYAGFDPGTNSGTTISTNTKYKFRGEGGNLYINGVLNSSCSTTNTLTSSTVPFYLFAVGTTSGAQNRNVRARIYQCKIWDEGVLVRHLIPCIRNSDDEVGMYELVNDVFYANSGTGKFIGYKPIDYIQSSGSQGIVLNYTPTSKDKISLDFAMTNTSSTSCLWCARGSTTGTNSTTAFYISNTGVRCDYGVSATMTTIGTLAVNTKHNLTMDSNIWYLDGVQKTSMTAATFTAGGKIRLFSSYTNGETNGLGNYSYIRFYGMKVYNSSGLIQLNLLPVKRLTDGVCGLYDKVNGTFYANIGSGSFTAGSS